MSISEKLLLSPDPIFQVSEAAHRLLEGTDDVAFQTAMVDHLRGGFRLLGFHSRFTEESWELRPAEQGRITAIAGDIARLRREELEEDWPGYKEDDFERDLRTPLRRLMEEGRLDEESLAALLRFLSKKTRPLTALADGIVRACCIQEDVPPSLILVNPIANSPGQLPPLNLLSVGGEPLRQNQKQNPHDSNAWADDLVRVFCGIKTDPEVRVIVLPIFDGVHVELSKGRFLGNLHLIFETEEARDRFLSKSASAWHVSAGGHVASAYRRAKLAMMASSEVTEKDYSDDRPALHHHLRQALEMDDWKKILVLDGSKVRQCWRRETADGPWLACPEVRECDRCLHDGDSLTITGELMDALPLKLLETQEAERLRSVDLQLEYPDDIRLPEAFRERRILERFYRREILRVWDVLFPKVILRQQILRKALRSMISGLLARSMAHDVGSHTLANAEVRLSESSGSDNWTRGDQEHLLRYVRERMIWVGEAATMPPYFLGLASLEEQVLKPYFGEKDEWKRRPVGLLLEDEMRGRAEGNGWRALVPKKLLGDPPLIALPNGSLGAQALYVLLDNILRNAAKYGAGKSDGDAALELYVRVDEDGENSGLVRLRLWDSWSTAQGGDDESKERWARLNSYCASRGTRRPAIRDEQAVADLVEKRGLGPQEERRWQLIDLAQEGEPLHEGGGIKEMRVAACWLRGENLEELLMPWEAARPPLLRPILIADGNAESIRTKWNELGLAEAAKIGYELYLQRARICVVIDPDLKTVLSSENKDRLLRQGVFIAANVDEVIAMGWGKATFAILGDASQEVSEHSRWLLPPRLLVVDRQEAPHASSSITRVRYAEISHALKAGCTNAAVQSFSSWIQMARSPGPSGVYLFFERALKDVVNGTALCVDVEYRLADEVTVKLVGSTSANPGSQPHKKFAFVNHGSYLHTLTKRENGFHDSWKSQRDLFSRVEEGFGEFHQTTNFFRALASAPEEYKDLFLWQLVEAMQIDVHILDDRLRAQADFSDRLGIKIHREESLSRFELDDDLPVIVVVHFAALEKAGVDKVQWVNQQLERALLVAVTSDRGEAIRKDLPHNATFLSSAAVHRCIAEESKLGLVQVLLSSRALEGDTSG